MTWIDVNDRLPEQDGKYQVKFELQVVPPIIIETETIYLGKEGPYWMGEFEVNKVTHWKPLVTDGL